MLIENTQWKEYLQPTLTIDFNSENVRAFIRDDSRENDPVAEQVISLYYSGLFPKPPGDIA
jgi:hypothetical protein